VTESDAVDVVEHALKRPASDLTTKEMALIALLKLSSRFPSCTEYDMISNVDYLYIIP
jgi:AP-1 complex subunit gamma-1